MQNKNILISGAGIAGPTLAFWLSRYGFNPTVVEHAPKPREGGYMIDFWGVGYDVAEKMGILDPMKKVSYKIQKLIFLGDRGEKKGALDLSKSIQLLDGRMLSLLRSDLANILYNSTKQNVRYLFDDTISNLEQTEEGVKVVFKKRGAETFDLVVGADGLHSNVRSQVFRNSNTFERFFGYYVASSTFDNFLGKDFTAKYSMYSMPNKQVGVYSLRENKISIFLIFKYLEKIGDPKKVLKEVFKEGKWACRHILEKLDEAPDFYFDAVSQIVLPKWSQGRVVLLGDAAFCPSLLSGQGAALAMAGAYVLAGELFQAGGDYSRAFASYEQIFKPFVEKKQLTAEYFIHSFVPSTRFNIWKRNMGSRLMGIPLFSRLYWKRFLIDAIRLKDYSSL
ncbi:MAG: FAD-dependent monooxygenase [Chlamydiales bacterium]